MFKNVSNKFLIFFFKNMFEKFLEKNFRKFFVKIRHFLVQKLWKNY